MLTGPRRSVPADACCARKLDQRADLDHAPDPRVVDLGQIARLDHLRVLERFPGGLDHVAADVAVVQIGGHPLVCGPLLHPVPDAGR